MMQTEFREAIEVRCNAVIGGGPTAVASISALQTIQDQATNHLDGDVRFPPLAERPSGRWQERAVSGSGRGNRSGRAVCFGNKISCFAVPGSTSRRRSAS